MADGNAQNVQNQNQAQSKKQNKNAEQYNADNLLFVHFSDHSSLVLVSEVLNETNYVTWSRSMKVALEARDKFGFINIEIEAPSMEDATYKQWRKDQFGGSNGPRVFELRRSIYTSKQAGDSVATYYNKLKRLWDELVVLKPSTAVDSGEEKMM
ncbi:hypothetical protein LIER_18485 [Lithospermum erythrorhizon]|uniref:Retrotransposon Copia-like N-terminal domain-containing protein n=1 Tax=Lithospermum erythrorhizon TaxID=34254 RepID=A0AAV3QIB9_LITER